MTVEQGAMSLIRQTARTEIPMVPESQVTAVVLELRAHDGRPGAAVVCADARYLSLQLRGDTRITRGYLPPSMWGAIESQVAVLEPGAEVDPMSAISEALNLVTDRALRATCRTVMTVTAPVFSLARALDAELHQKIGQPDTEGRL
jgi:hypothetical protein